MAGTLIGLSNLNYALMTGVDGISGMPTYGTPALIAPAIKVKVNPNASIETLFADDGPYDAATVVGKIDLELNPQDVSLDIQAILLGHTISGGVLLRKSTDIPPYVAIGFQAMKSNGAIRYVWLTKGKFAMHEQDFQTREDKVTFQSPTLKAQFLRRIWDAVWIKQADTESATYVSSIGTNWFTYVETAPSPLTVTAAPIQGATAVPKAAAVITWTYNNALAGGQLNGNNFAVVATTTGVQVPGTLAIDGTGKIVTFSPTSTLAATTLYLALADMDVVDTYGQKVLSAGVPVNTTDTWTTGV